MTNEYVRQDFNGSSKKHKWFSLGFPLKILPIKRTRMVWYMVWILDFQRLFVRGGLFVDDSPGTFYR